MSKNVLRAPKSRDVYFLSPDGNLAQPRTGLILSRLAEEKKARDAQAAELRLEPRGRDLEKHGERV